MSGDWGDSLPEILYTREILELLFLARRGLQESLKLASRQGRQRGALRTAQVGTLKDRQVRAVCFTGGLRPGVGGVHRLWLDWWGYIDVRQYFRRDCASF